MRTKRNILYVLTLISLCAFTAFFAIDKTYAVEEKPEYRMDIYPAQKDLGDVEQGRSYSDIFTLENSGKQGFDYEISFTPYSVIGDSYEPDYDKETQYTEIAKWITVDEYNGHLESGEKTNINYTVTIPNGTHGGGQAAVIMITMGQSGQNSGTGVEAVRRLGYLVFGNVDGEVIKTGKVLNNKIPSFLFNPPILGSSLVENTGNVYTRASYKLQVFPLFSDEEVYTNEEKPEENIVFPNTKRYSETKWDGSPSLGIFRVRQTVKIFDDETVTEKLVFICPIWFLFICVLVIFIIIFSIVNYIRNRSKEN